MARPFSRNNLALIALIAIVVLGMLANRRTTPAQEALEPAALGVLDAIQARDEDRRRARTKPTWGPENDHVVVGAIADPVLAPGQRAGDNGVEPPTALQVVRLDVVAEQDGKFASRCIERLTTACADCGADCASLRPTDVVRVAAVSAVLGCKPHGPIISLLLAVGRWRYPSTGTRNPAVQLVPDAYIDVHVEAVVTVHDGSGTMLREFTVTGRGEHNALAYSYEPNLHGAAVVEIPLPSNMFNYQFASAENLKITARLSVVCTHTVNGLVPRPEGSVGSPLSAMIHIQLTSQIDNVRIDFPIGLTAATFAQLVGGIPTSPAVIPRMVACYGPLFAFGVYPPMFFEYLIEFIEYHRHVGVAHMAFYFWMPEVSPDLEAFKKLYENDGNLVTVVHYDRLTPVADVYNFGQRVVINDCLARFKSYPQFVFVGDIDEWLYPSRTATVPEALEQLVKVHTTPPHSSATHYQFFVDHDYVHQANVCDPISTSETAAAASERIAREKPLLLSRSPYFYTNCHLGGARRKTVSLARQIVAAEEHEPVGGEQSPVSMGEASGIIKVHARDLPHIQPPPGCTTLAPDFLESAAALGASLDCPVLKTVKLPYFAEGYITAVEKVVVRQRSRFHRILEGVD